MIKNQQLSHILLFAAFVVIAFAAAPVFAQSPNKSIPSAIEASMKLAQKNQYTNALKKLDNKKLLEGEHKDFVHLLKGRYFFNLKKYQQSLESYLKISQNSEHWLASVEERAWVRVHLKQKNEAIADSLTLMSPLFSDVVSAEAYYLSAYVAHQVCDFTRLFKIIEIFKDKGKSQLIALEESQKKRPTRSGKHKLNLYSDVIKQLHLIEADAIQRIYLDQQLAGKRDRADKITNQDPYALQFPYDEEDVWIDEVDSLKVSAKNCPKPFQQVVSR